MSTPPAVERLVLEAQRGDPAAFDELATLYRERLLRFIRARLGAGMRRSFDPEDLLQETLLRAFRSLGGLEWRGEAALGGWLERIALNVVQRSAKRRVEAPIDALEEQATVDDGSQGHRLRREERFDRLQEALDALDPESRKVIVLTRIRGLSIRDAAKELGRTPSATSVLLFRAAKKLKASFGDTESFSLPPRRLRDTSGDEERVGDPERVDSTDGDDFDEIDPASSDDSEGTR